MFEFATVGRLVVGEGARRILPSALAGWGRRFLLVTGGSVERAREVALPLEEAGYELERVVVVGEPTVADAVRAGAVAREWGAEGVIGVGGGSVLDGAKAAAAFATNGGDPLRYLEVIGEGKPLEAEPLPFVAVATTAGTGTEVTRNAVLASPEHRVKVSLRSPRMLARLAVVDAELTYGLPPALTASSGLDALTQLIEAYVSVKANPLTDALCLEGMERAARALAGAYVGACRVAAGGAAGDADVAERRFRGELAIAALFSGFALANAGLGAVHGLAGPVGGMFPAPHGAVCAALLPGVMAANVRTARAAEGMRAVVDRFTEVARRLTGRAEATAEEGVAWVVRVCRELGVQPLRSFGLRSGDVGAVVVQAMKASSMKGNPVVLTEVELAGVLEAAL